MVLVDRYSDEVRAGSGDYAHKIDLLKNELSDLRATLTVRWTTGVDSAPTTTRFSTRLVALMNHFTTRRCAKCKGEYDEEAFFRVNPDSRLRANASARRFVCIGCELTARTEEKEQNRWRVKARDSIRRHAAKYHLDPAEFGQRYRWSLDQIEHDLKHAYENGCSYCKKPYKGMVHGLADITIDVVQPRELPFYDVNVKCCCQTCNREKSKMPSELWARKLIAWDYWEANRLRRDALPKQVQTLMSFSVDN